MKRGHDWHAELAQQRKNVRASLTAKDPVLVLDREHIYLVDVQEIRGALIRAEIPFCDLESDARRIRVPTSGIVHREHKAIRVRQLARHGLGEMRRECGDATVARQMVAKNSESLHLYSSGWHVSGGHGRLDVCGRSPVEQPDPLLVQPIMVRTPKRGVLADCHRHAA